MLSNAACSFSILTVALAAWFWISAVCWRSICEVDSMTLPVVPLRALIWSSTSRWLPSASAAITAVRSAEPGGHVGVLLQPTLHLPEVCLFLLERGVVPQQLVLTAIEASDDRLDLRL